MKRLFCIILLLVIGILIPLGISAQHEFLIQQKEKIRIYYALTDSANARIALDEMIGYYNEISHDLSIENTDTLHIYIIPTRQMFKEIIDGQLPNWTGAFASPASNSMYVRSPNWEQDSNFITNLVHELLHLVIHEKMGVARLPRWMDEGLAIFYSNDYKWISSTALSKAFATRSVLPLYDIDRVLSFHRARAELAYQQSYSAVQYLLATYDIDAVRAILKSLQNHESIDLAFQKATGSTYAVFEKEWLAYAKKKYKWTWLNDFDSYIWTLIIVLFFIAGIVIRIRNKRKLAEWEQLPPDIEPLDE